ncbi:hypothetical protein H072_2947 [Dactylellina haptotyla CBS 200.50]|uniref:Uncharacterized protein n=1 Tax=Dactylellina haptotyla (strain CBS 200.50) TaxID=1284197 RepID=S8AJL6_DACHA|nr:hypothetical protein H072_2947 [Dactylellina haptotyla CBS 200.50]
MHFIRFLKVPSTSTGTHSSSQSSRSRGSQGLVSVSALITISTDLNESFFAGNVTLRATLRACDAPRPLVAQEFKWTKGMRSIPVNLTYQPAIRDAPLLGIMCISAAENRADDMRTLYAGSSEARILSAWSTPFNILQSGSKAEALVERKLQLGTGMLRIIEETREDIARHIWPGGLAISSYLSTLPSPPTGTLRSLEPIFSKSQIQVLELGAGCGLAGLALHAVMPKATVTVTDLPITAEITSRNIELFTQAAQGPIQIRYEPLDWDESLPSWCSSTTYDLILVADCTYNTESIPYLVKVLDELCTISPDVTIFLAHKVRHDSEEMFFEMAKERGLVKTEQLVFEMAGDTVDLYIIRKEKKE